MIIHGNAAAIPLRDESVHCTVTSPPYWGLRWYGPLPQIWGGDPDCSHDWGQWLAIHTRREDRDPLVGKSWTTDRSWRDDPTVDSTAAVRCA